MIANKDCKIVWNKCLGVIRDILQNEQLFNTWFKPIVPLQLENSVLTIQVPSHYFYEYLEEHYIDLLRKTIRRELGNGAQLRYTILMERTIGSGTNVVLPSTGYKAVHNLPKDMPININTENAKDFPNPFTIPGIQKVRIHSQLNGNYTLENFVEGECNRLARSAGYAIAENPGRTSFNPLLIYGNAGLGKTHLVHAIGIKTKEKYPDKTVLYVTAEQFSQQFREASANQTVNDFMHFYEMIDVLIIDDIHFWENRVQKTQEAFFHIFNYLHQRGKQIIITTDKAPADLAGLESRLISRLKWGLSADIQAPNVETRMAILKQKLANDGVEMPHEVIEYIAYNINTNVRELEGALISLMAQSSLNKKQITIDLAKQMIDKFVKNTAREITIDYIQKVICDYFNLPIESIQSHTRKREIVQARQLAMYFAKKMTKASLAIIGLQCGNKDHATVLHACKTVTNLAETDKQFRFWVEELEKKFNQ